MVISERRIIFLLIWQSILPMQHVYAYTIRDTILVKRNLEQASLVLSENPSLAFPFCEEALEISKSIRYGKGELNARGYLAYLHEQQGEIDLAVSQYEAALILARKEREKTSEAVIMNNLAAIFKDRGNMGKALSYHRESYAIHRSLRNESGMATSLNNQGLIYQSIGNYPLALEYYNKAIKVYEGLNDTSGITTIYGNLGTLYKEQGQYPESIEYQRKSLSMLAGSKLRYELAHALNVMGSTMIDLGQTDSALYWLDKALQIRKELGDIAGMGYTTYNLGRAKLVKGNADDALRDFRSALQLFEGSDATLGKARVLNSLGELFFKSGDTLISARYFKQSYTIARELGFPKEIMQSSLNLYKIYKKQKNWQEAITMFDFYVQMKDSIENEENRKTAIRTKFKQEFEKRESELIRKQELEKSKAALVRNVILAILGAISAFTIIIVNQRNKISYQRKRSDKLLLNILPEPVAEELKAKGTADAKHFDSVTVLFSDFKGFTGLAEIMTPAELVDMLNHCFSEFDRIVLKHRLEKIKTIGDAYMAAGGLPVERLDHAVSAVSAALEMTLFVQKLRKKMQYEGKPFFEIRIGIHSGPVVAGIVGLTKFQYDIWGDTVNTASRMESSGEVGKVNISESTFQLVKDHFKCTPRGMIHAKGKGKVTMYFVDPITTYV